MIIKKMFSKEKGKEHQSKYTGKQVQFEHVVQTVSSVLQTCVRFVHFCMVLYPRCCWRLHSTKH